MDPRLTPAASPLPDAPLPGERWVSKGRAGHGYYDVHVKGYSAGGRVVFEVGHDAGQSKRSRPHSIPLHRFLQD
jgi:hypothetical protein